MSIKTSVIPVRELVARFGVTRADLRHVIYTKCSVPPDYLSAMQLYKLIKLSGQEFKDHLKDGMYYGYDSTSGKHILFHTVYKNCTPYNVKRAKEVKLSFRIAQEEFNIEPVVVVQITAQSEAYRESYE